MCPNLKGSDPFEATRPTRPSSNAVKLAYCVHMALLPLQLACVSPAPNFIFWSPRRLIALSHHRLSRFLYTLSHGNTLSAFPTSLSMQQVAARPHHEALLWPSSPCRPPSKSRGVFCSPNLFLSLSRPFVMTNHDVVTITVRSALLRALTCPHIRRGAHIHVCVVLMNPISDSHLASRYPRLHVLILNPSRPHQA